LVKNGFLSNRRNINFDAAISQKSTQQMTIGPKISQSREY